MCLCWNFIILIFKFLTQIEIIAIIYFSFKIFGFIVFLFSWIITLAKIVLIKESIILKNSSSSRPIKKNYLLILSLKVRINNFQDKNLSLLLANHHYLKMILTHLVKFYSFSKPICLHSRVFLQKWRKN